MKKKLWLLLVALCCFGGCGKEEKQIELLNTDKALFVYEGTEEADQIAVDEEGILYTLAYEPDKTNSQPVSSTEHVYQAGRQILRIYDLSGSCIEEQELFFGNGTPMAMFAEGDALYVLNPKSADLSVVYTIYKIDTTTGNVEEVAALPGFSFIKHFVHLGDYFYVLGIAENAEAKNYTLHPDVISYEYAGEAVARINVEEENPMLEQIQIEFPISFFTTNKNTLVIYAYTEEKGFGYFEFDPVSLTLTEAGTKSSSVKDYWFTACEEGALFYKDRRLYYGTVDGMEAEISSEDVTLFHSPTYRNGFAFYKNYRNDGAIERVCVADVMQDNKVIHLLMHNDVQDKPYGCGYRMEKEVLTSEQYALKVLAQDSDFDAYVLSSRDNSSYNLMKNGAFYPLNEVEGVQEYLDACFPYVKELAANEEGDIWMLPVSLAIPGLVYHKEYNKENTVNYEEMDFAEFLNFSAEVRAEHPELASLSTYVIVEELFGQYLNRYDTFDTQLFRDYAMQVKKITGGSAWHFNFEKSDEICDGKLPEFYYLYEVYQYQCKLYANVLGTEESIGMMGVPKLEGDIGNMGTITFLAVNPQSQNLEATLDYISAFASYMLSKKDSFMLADKSTYVQTPFIREMYQVYAEGEIRFDMDTEVYETLFYSYLAGKLELEEMVAEIERRRKLYMEE